MESDKIKQLIKDISDSLIKKGYDPITQIMGYLMSDDLGYIPEFDNNRNKIAKLDRTIILESILREYLK